MGFFATIGRGWALSKLSFAVVRKDPELMLYTFLSGMMVLATVVVAALPGRSLRRGSRRPSATSSRPTRRSTRWCTSSTG